MSPRHAPDPSARRVLEKLLASAASDPHFAHESLESLTAYCARAYQLGLDRGRREKRNAVLCLRKP